jgi:hypothetical protein
MAILPNAQGVTKLFKSTLTRIIEDKEYSEEVAAGEPYLDVLKKDFGIGLQITDGLLLG